MPYTVQCRSYSKKTVNQLYNYSTVLGAAIKCKPYSEITVDIWTHLKTVKITLNIFAVWYIEFLPGFLAGLDINPIYGACCSVQMAHKPVSTSSAEQ